MIKFPDTTFQTQPKAVFYEISAFLSTNATVCPHVWMKSSYLFTEPRFQQESSNTRSLETILEN